MQPWALVWFILQMTKRKYTQVLWSTKIWRRYLTDGRRESYCNMKRFMKETGKEIKSLEKNYMGGKKLKLKITRIKKLIFPWRYNFIIIYTFALITYICQFIRNVNNSILTTNLWCWCLFNHKWLIIACKIYNNSIRNDDTHAETNDRCSPNKTEAKL